MQTIIQLSDFHIKSTMGLPEHNSIFRELVHTLKGMNLEKIILLYNGDVIDSKSIDVTIDKTLSNDKKAELWDKKAEELFDLAKKYFDFLTNELNIANDHIIICCGNHDVNTYYETGKSILTCPGRKTEVTYNSKRFGQFAKFCDSVQLRKNTSGTYFREIDNINFLILNTNWINKWSPKGRCDLCISCNEIKQLIEQKRDKLDRTKIEKSKLHNILVAHAPYTNYCEEALFAFKENDYSAISDHIDYLFGLKLYGDKHTDKIRDFDYIVGAPLDEERITCGIHQFDDNYCHHFKSLIYDNKKWRILGSEKDIGEILDISKDSIKAQTLQYLYGTKKIPDLEKKILEFDSTISSEKWGELDRLIRTYADIQQPQLSGAGKRVSSSTGFINTLTRIISDSTKKDSITMRGEARLGKSVCMSLLYMNLLHRFSCGTFEYMPVYINIEEIIKQINYQKKNSLKFLNLLQNIVKEKLLSGIELAKKLQRPACCLIDGINKYYLYENARIEDMVANQVEGNIGKQYARFIYCIDVSGNNKLGSTPQDVKKDSEFIVYFNRLLTKQFTSQKKYTSFIREFCALRNDSTKPKLEATILNNIERMQIKEVDTNLLVNFWEELNVNNEKSFFAIVSDYATKLLGHIELSKASEACFLYHYNGKSYSEISRITKISYNIFELIRTQKQLIDYLIAVNYINHIKNSEHSTSINPCLNVLYNHDICAFIREYICTYNLQNQLLDFSKSKYEKLSYEGKATITYLLGRIKYTPAKINAVFNSQYNIINAAKNEKDDSLTRSIALRSIRLSRMFVSTDSNKQMYDYIYILLSNKHERKINRLFYLEFYGDSPIENMDNISEGFDIYNTYNVLANRLNRWLDTNNRYPLLELELFTLCDLIQMRIDTPKAKSNKGKEVNSFFYNKRFNLPSDEMAKNIITFISVITKKYLEVYGHVDDNLLFLKYLTVQNKQYEKLLVKLSKGPLVLEDDEYSQESLLRQLLRLEKVKRIGWSISEVPEKNIDEKSFKKIQKEGEILETTLHHTYEAYLIGLLYLPKHSECDITYDKQEVLNMILVHDIGESHVGDIIPAYENYEQSRKDEKEFCEFLFLQGTHLGIADLSDYFMLWEQWCDELPSNYNVKIAKEIDVIQMLYKLLLLLYEGKISFSKNRLQDFWLAKNSIKTPEGKFVFNVLIAKNRDFINTAKKHELLVTELI